MENYMDEQTVTETGVEQLANFAKKQQGKYFTQLPDKQQQFVRALLAVLDMHPLYAVRIVAKSSDSGYGVAIGLETRYRTGKAEALGMVAARGDDRGTIFINAKDIRASFKAGITKQREKIAGSMDTLTTAISQITDGLLNENPEDIELLDRHKPQPLISVADKRILAAARSIDESLKARRESYKGDSVPEGTVYVWPDLRASEGYGYWRFLAVLGDEFYAGKQTLITSDEAALMGARQLPQLSGKNASKKHTYTKTEKGREVIDETRTKVISNQLPPKKYWDKCEEVFKVNNKPRLDPKKVVESLNAVVAEAKSFSARLAGYEGLAESRAYDEYVADIEKAIVAIDRVGIGGRIGFPPRMFIGRYR